MRPEKHASSRREFLKDTGRIAAATALAGSVIPNVHAGENNKIRLALVGCGSRGTGAVVDAMRGNNGPITLVAMADVVKDRVQSSYGNLKKEFGDTLDVPQDRQFVGFDAYRKAMDCLEPGDVVIMATPPGFRWAHFSYAIEKGLHVFMEKPLTVDGPTSRKFLALAEESVKKNLKVGVGLMFRHCRARQELYQRIKAGEIGDIATLRAYRMHGPWVGFFGAKTTDMSELLYQVRGFHGFLWASGGIFSDWNIHQIDECCWMKDAWPVQAMALGGRHYRGDCVDQNFDNYSVEYTFADGSKFFFLCRGMPGCYEQFSSYAEGSKGTAVITTSLAAAKCRIFKGQTLSKDNVLWKFPQPEPNPYRLEWNDLIDAIRQDKPYNEAKRGVEASLVTSMGRMAAHTGQVITYEQMLNCPHEFAPGVDKLTMDSPAPVLAGPNGKYPIPQPGIVTDREY
jgi:predicted dehydrogenase